MQMKKAASPILYAGRKNPPTLLMCGDQDLLLEPSQKMYDLLKKAGNEAELITVPGQDHGFFDGELYYEEIFRFLDRVLKQQTFYKCIVVAATISCLPVCPRHGRVNGNTKRSGKKFPKAGISNVTIAW